MTKTNLDEDVIHAWKKRSLIYKDKIEGVLPKSFPLSLNLYLDSWMYKAVQEPIENKSNQRILDIGCGYGRLAERIPKTGLNNQVLGIDVAKEYVDIFNQRLGPKSSAMVAKATKIPFPADYFDHAYVVTTYMYLNGKDQQIRAFKELLRVIKPGGTFTVIERSPMGYGFVTLWGLISVLRGKKHQEIKATSYSPNGINKLISHAGGTLTKVYGMPVFTLLLPFLLAIGKFKFSIPARVIRFIAYLDHSFRRILLPSLYISYIGRK